jgi:nitrate/TMAO reductase-like tetraheme cytochrome c subunit
MRRILRVAGIQVPVGTGQPLILQRRFFYCLAAAAFLAVAGSGGMLLLSGHSSFCRSCHIMEPYYQSWKTSPHGQRGVECLKCHAASGIKSILKVKFQALRQVASYVTGTYGTRLHAEIPDAACLRPGCHEKRLLEGKGQVEFTGLQGHLQVPVRFDHKPHLTETRRGKQLRCQTCHSQIVQVLQGGHLTVTESVCFTCHFKGYRYDDPVAAASPTANCTLCHAAPSQPVKLATGDTFSHKDYIDRAQVQCMMCHADCLQGTGSVPGQVCMACHSKTEDLQKRGDTPFLHQTHVTDHHVECFYCHSEIRHGKDAVHGGEDISCAQCHTDRHAQVATLYRGRGAHDVKAQPSVMWAASVQCIACHRAPAAGGKTSPEGLGEATGASCAACHGDAVDGMIATWKADAAKSVGQAQKAVEEAAARLAALPDAPEKEAGAKLLAEAREDLKFVVAANPVHNPEYASSILENVCSKAAQVAQAHAPK